MRFPITLLLLLSLRISARAVDLPPGPGEDTLTEQEKRVIREADKKNPAEAEQIIQRLDEARHQAWKYKSHPESIGKELRELVENMRAANRADSQKDFAKARGALQGKVRWFEEQRVRIPIEAANQAAGTLLDIYDKRATYTSAPDFLPIEFAAKHANSPRARAYLLGKIRSGSRDEKTFALTSLAWSKSFGGDAEMFGELEKLYNVEGKQNPIILGVMSRLDRKKALPFVLKEIDSTKDVYLFTKDEDTLSEYGRVDLLYHALKRVGEFPRTSWTSEKNPTLGIYPELLLKYIQQAEGEQLRLGLDALEQNIGALLNAYPVVKKKLGSGRAEDRRASARFLNHMTAAGRFRGKDVVTDLEGQLDREPDQETKRHLRETVERLKKDLRR